MPGRKVKGTHRVKGAYHYAKRRDGTKYRVYHNGTRGKGSYGRYAGKRTPYKKSRKSMYNRPMSGVVTGYGSYRLNGRSLNPGTQAPKVKNSKGGFCVQHKEFIGDIPASQAFIAAGLFINPGLSQCFPWLSQIAQNFEEWRPKGILFYFKSTSSNAVVSTNANAALGTVIMATEYNVSNGVFGNKQQMEMYEGAVSVDPSKNMTHTVETAKSQNPLGIYFVRNGAVPANNDQRFYDLGLFQIASVGMQANGNVIGELWISYDIEFKKPRVVIGQSLANEPAMDHFGIYAVGATTVDTTITPATPFGTLTGGLRGANTASTLKGYVSGGIVAVAAQPNGGIIPVLDSTGTPTGVFGSSTANTYYFPPGITNGDFMIQYNAVYTTGGSASWNPVITPTNCTPLPNLMNADTQAIVSNTGTTAVTTTMVTFFLRVTKANAKFTIVGTNSTFATPLWADLFVTLIPAGLN